MAERLYHRNQIHIQKCHINRYHFASKLLNPTDYVMDYGSGCGYGTHLLAPYCKAIIGVDKSEEAYKFSRTYYMRHNMDYIISSSPVSNNKFDKIVAYEVVEHVEDPLTLMTQFYNSLKPGGRLIMSVPNQSVVPFNKDKYEFHYRHFTPAELKDLIEKAGFKKYRSHYQLDKRVPRVMQGDWIGYTSIALCDR